MDLGVGEMGFIFCGKRTSSPHEKDPGERSRAHSPLVLVTTTYVLEKK